MVAQLADFEPLVFKAIADPTRRAILDELRAGDQRATDIAELFASVSRQAIAKHLKVLDEAGLVTIERSGRERRYGLNPGPLRQIDEWLDGHRTALARRLVDLKSHAEQAARHDQGEQETGDR
ncbi:MAG: ArsR family transcriptional regulator [Phycisphaera sp.]|nr:MAG: ArsR family transcriptional regulator [Phycisphaera sp.]